MRFQHIWKRHFVLSLSSWSKWLTRLRRRAIQRPVVMFFAANKTIRATQENEEEGTRLKRVETIDISD